MAVTKQNKTKQNKMKIITTIIMSALIFGWVVTRPYAQQPSVIASHYHDKYVGRLCADGKTKYDHSKMIAAHRTLPFGTMVKVSLAGSKTRFVNVKIVDRGPYIRGRENGIDLSASAFKKLAQIEAGLLRVNLTVLK